MKGHDGIDKNHIIETNRGPVSVPFDAAEHRRISVSIMNKRGIKSLKIVEVE